MTILEPDYNWAFNPGNRTRTSYLILHHAAASSASPMDVHNWHLARAWAGIAYHYYVRKDGSVYRGRPENWIGGHTADYNNNSIGICFEGNFETEEMPRVQMDSGRRLVSDILKRYPSLTVLGHKDLNATACPGKNFPFEYITSPAQPVEPNEQRYKTVEEVPQWARPTVEKLIGNGSLIGTGNDLDLSHDMVRILVICDRNGLFKEDT
ncbi:MAG TPA: N-acetylmuramoyl-L-alanine amidase [Clostridiales bacterium]|jgi:N-acetyl-anhydromuramyl-L-alanine amidase AmpD|nr:N-acetylmuramoyl-L-alanine amidase [Clostridiales bacterium]